MKKIVFVIIYLVMLSGSVVAAQYPFEEQKPRDSIFKVYHSIVELDDRIVFLYTTFHKNMDQKWAIELLDSALDLTIANNKNKLELNVRIDYYRYYKYLGDLSKMETCLNELKTACFKYKVYKFYFQVWSDMLQFYNVRGDTEHVRMQSLKMEEEAKAVNCQEGIDYAKISMARSLAASKKEEEAIKLYKEALKSETVQPLTRVLIHDEIVGAYQQIGNNEEAIKALHAQKVVLEQYINENPNYASAFRENRMQMELSYCSVYDNMGDTNNLLKHLNEAKKLYAPNCFFSNFIGYHAYWGAYYRLTHQWEKCFREFDVALAHFDNIQPLYEMVIQRMKGKALYEAGRYKDAAKLYKKLAFMGDSLNRDIVELHQEALQANYNIRKALLDKENLEIQYSWIVVCLIVLLALIVLLMVLRTHKVHRKLRRSEHETREALEIVDTANKMKEVFLHNITHQIRGPLNAVVGFSELLATEKELTPEQIQEYSMDIKKNADLLSQLIFDVLDLSRLESGMMKFNVSDCDVVQLCKDAKMMVEMQEHNLVQLLFETNLDILIIHADSARFLKLLVSVLTAPRDCGEALTVKYTLSRGNDQLKIVVENSPLLKQLDNIQSIKHDINRLFLEIFKGSYQISSGQDKENIIIEYPLK